MTPAHVWSLKFWVAKLALRCGEENKAVKLKFLSNLTDTNNVGARRPWKGRRSPKEERLNSGKPDRIQMKMTAEKTGPTWLTDRWPTARTRGSFSASARENYCQLGTHLPWVQMLFFSLRSTAKGSHYFQQIQKHNFLKISFAMLISRSVGDPGWDRLTLSWRVLRLFPGWGNGCKKAPRGPSFDPWL